MLSLASKITSNELLRGGFQTFLIFTPGEMIQFDQQLGYFSNGLKSPTRLAIFFNVPCKKNILARNKNAFLKEIHAKFKASGVFTGQP